MASGSHTVLTGLVWHHAGRFSGLSKEQVMRRAYKFRMRPTKGQHSRLAAVLECHRELYNAALQERRDAWQMARQSVSYGEQSAQLKEIRLVRADVAVWSFSSQQATLRRLNRAFASFFRRVRAGQPPGYPRFKSRDRFDSVEWPEDGDGCRWKPEVTRIYLQGVGDVKVTAHRVVEGRVKTVRVKRDGRKWYLILSCDDTPPRRLKPTGATTGIDVGIVDFAVTSDGAHIENPRWEREAGVRLKAARQRLTRKQRGSNNRHAAKETLATRHRKVANQRRDWHHKKARQLVRNFDVLFVEAMHIANMVRRAKARPDPDQPGQFLPNGAAAKAGLNRSSMMRAGRPSSTSSRPKRKRLGGESLTWTPGTPPTGAKPAGTLPTRTASASHCSSAKPAATVPKQMNKRRGTFSGLDWPFSRLKNIELREKRLAASAVREVTPTERAELLFCLESGRTPYLARCWGGRPEVPSRPCYDAQRPLRRIRSAKASTAACGHFAPAGMALSKVRAPG